MDYSPDTSPDPEAWLALSEEQRIDRVSTALQAFEEVGDLTGLAIFLTVVENQAALGSELPVRATIDRLEIEGLERFDALLAISEVLQSYTLETLEGEPFDEGVYRKRLNAIRATDWMDEEENDSAESDR